ncbi:hypothetical protein Tdes44962_MAKER09311 [Teratosphaeria destructans]|uniref:Uncharacterized protein n=1 Tax=Teratosphaeria destructans TaxID=418781 RepID=A0A9W7W312_9PEZI|nr:hypothetical protein Tdes44962_MAKER09311 [Teratosphaeria destructans]
MSHKFFTWTKGDRRNAADALRAGGVLRPPDECIAIYGLDGARSSKDKSRRKPLPLDLSQSTNSPAKHSRRTSDSIALQSAAVQSATSLLAVMNEVLRSPHVAGHLSAQYCAPPAAGRPRSHTAPSTPLVEAPFVEPVELHGSRVADKDSTVSLRRSFDGNNDIFARLTTNGVIGPTIVRPHTSPHEESTSVLAHHEPPPSQSFRPSSSLAPPAQSSPQYRSPSPRPSPTRPGTTLYPPPGEDTLVARDHDTSTLGTQRPSLSMLQTWPAESATSSTSMATSRTTSTQTDGRHGRGPADAQELQLRHHSAADHESELLSQIAIMRARHEAHLNSVKEAHERELEGHLSYISLLEKRAANPLAPPATLQRQLTLDTSHGAPRAIDMPSADASATTVHSSEASFINQKRSSEGAVAETEALKRKLSLCNKAVAEAGDVRRERDHLREVTDRNERRILQLKDIVRKTKDQEKTLKNTVADLEARLVAANNERTDVLEGFHEACQAVKSSAKREAAMRAQIEGLHSRLFYDPGRHTTDTSLALPISSPPRRQRHGRTVSDVGTSQHRSALAHGNRHPSDYEKCLKELQQKLEKAEADCEQYNALLHSEIRRQSRSASQSTPYFNSEAAKEANAKLQSLKADSDAAGAAGDFLERELQHCLTEIVLYKLDIRGYKKDLKRARAQIEILQTATVKALPTPDRNSTSSVKSSKSTQRHRSKSYSTSNAEIKSGLGISISSRATTPTHEASPAIKHALMTVTPTVPPTIRSPSARPKTHLSAHKKLPPPPPQTPSPLIPAQASPPPTSSVARLNRDETVRSISDSIISSYAKRTPEQQAAGQSPVTTGQPPTPSRSVGTTPVFEPLRSHPVLDAVGLSAC